MMASSCLLMSHSCETSWCSWSATHADVANFCASYNVSTSMVAILAPLVLGNVLAREVFVVGSVALLCSNDGG